MGEWLGFSSTSSAFYYRSVCCLRRSDGCVQVSRYDFHLHSQEMPHIFLRAYLPSNRISSSWVKCLFCVLSILYLDIFKKDNSFESSFIFISDVWFAYVFALLQSLVLSSSSGVSQPRFLILKTSNVSISFYGSHFWCQILRSLCPTLDTHFFFLEYFPLKCVLVLNFTLTWVNHFGFVCKRCEVKVFRLRFFCLLACLLLCFVVDVRLPIS